MARDLFLKKNSRNWSRGGDAPARSPDTAISGSAALKKAALGTMALGTLAGLAFITAPWWKPLPEQPRRITPTQKRMRLIQIHPSARVTWSKR